MDGSEGEHSDWPLRPWVLAGGLAFAGLLVWLASDAAQDTPWRMAATAFVLFGSLAAAFTVERDRWKQPLAFALLAGFVMAGLAWRATAAGDRYADEQFWVASGAVALALALPLFQAGFHRTRFATPYARVHYHVWSDAISAAGSMAFVGAAWLLAVVLSELFLLLKIELLRQLMNEEWFGWTYSGAAFGAALGTMRNQLKILATLQALAMTVLSILAVPLAAGLALFLVAMAVSGPQVLWDATRSATPVLLLCAAGAWVLANAILRDSDSGMSGNRVLRWAAFALALSILPLTVFAAVSLGTRIDQHGLSPERIWGLIAIVVACVYGVAWLASLVRGWRPGDWRERLRRANLHLAALICLVAFVLALPILDFGAISARNQVARLESGAVSPERFDFTALRWDFGDAGRRLLTGLARGSNAEVARLAQSALEQDERAYATFDGVRRTRADFNLRVQPDDPELRELVLDYLTDNPHRCQERCVALDVGATPSGDRRLALVQSEHFVTLVVSPDRGLQDQSDRGPVTLRPESTVEVSEARVIRVDGRALSQTLD